MRKLVYTEPQDLGGTGEMRMNWKCALGLFATLCLLSGIIAVGICLQDRGRACAQSSSQVILWDTMKKYTDKWPFSQALADRDNWQQVPYGVTDYEFVGDAMIESDQLYLFLFSNDEDSPCLAAKLAGDRVWTNEIYKVHDTGYRNFGMGNMWVKIIKNTPEEVIVESAEKGMRFGPPPVPITTFYRIVAGKPWLEVKPSANVNQQGQHDKRRLAGFLFEDVGQDVILDARKHGQFEENVYPEQGCIGVLIFHRAYNPPDTDYDFMWFMTFPPGAEQHSLTYAGIHYPDPYWEWDCKPCAPSVGATYVYLEQKVIIGILNSQDIWKREDVGQPIAVGETYTSTFTAPYAGKWRMAAVFSDDDWYITDYITEVVVSAGDPFTFNSPRNGTLDYLVFYMYDRTDETPTEVYTPMDIYRETIAAPQVVSVAPTGVFVPLSPTISITFSEPMSRTATEGAISISGVVPTGFAWSSGDTRVNFVPSTPLTYTTTYTVTVSTAAADQEGEHLLAPYGWQFTTRPEVIYRVYLPVTRKGYGEQE